MSIQPLSAPDSAPDPEPLAEVIQLPGVEVVDEPAEDIHVHDITCSPLYPTHGRQANWSGEIVTDRAAIRRRVEAGVAREARRRAWRRTFRRIARGGAR